MPIDPAAAGTVAACKAMSRLLRFVTRPANVMARDGQAVRLAAEDGRCLTVPAVLLGAAERRGLVRREASAIVLRPEGRAFLRRALADPDGAADQAFQAQHRETAPAVLDVEGRPQAVLVNASESPLAILRRLKMRDGAPFLDDAAFAAGERLRADFTRGQMQPRVTANWDAAVSSGPRGARNGIADLSDTALAARARVKKAMAAVGPDLAGVLVDVCCFLKGVETVERERQWPVRSGKLMLRTALRMLARHYGLS